jgi:excisionase family DNA binding protein
LTPEPLSRADVLTASEASELLGIPRSTLYDLARRGELPARQIGRRWVFRRSLLNRATLPPTEPESWRTDDTDTKVPGLKMVGPLPATVARSVRSNRH